MGADAAVGGPRPRRAQAARARRGDETGGSSPGASTSSRSSGGTSREHPDLIARFEARFVNARRIAERWRNKCHGGTKPPTGPFRTTSRSSLTWCPTTPSEAMWAPPCARSDCDTNRESCRRPARSPGGSRSSSTTGTTASGCANCVSRRPRRWTPLTPPGSDEALLPRQSGRPALGEPSRPDRLIGQLAQRGRRSRPPGASA